MESGRPHSGLNNGVVVLYMSLRVLINLAMCVVVAGAIKMLSRGGARLKSKHFVSRAQSALHCQKPLKEATTLFSEWAADGRDKRMADGHEMAVSEMLKVAEPYLPTKFFNFLDLGTGNGWVARRMAGHPRCKSSLGVDGADKMIENAIELEQIEKTGASFVTANLMEFQAKQAVDVIFSMEVLYYLQESEVEQLFKNISTWLTPGGLFIWGIDHYEENELCHDWSSINGVHMLLWTENRWRKAMEAAGLHVIKGWRAANRPEYLNMPGASADYQGKAGTLAFLVRRRE